MRLICPNCGAQYEVDANMLPADGRDVQCSNCGTTWYQEGPRRNRVAEPEPEVAVRRAASGGIAGTAEADEAAPRRQRTPAEAAEGGLEILREEAAQESRLRAGEAGGLETQPELGLDEAGLDDSAVEDRAMEARNRRLARTEEIDTKAGVIASPVSPPEGRPGGSRRDLLPDIEEINSTLRPDERVQNDDEDLDPELRAAMAATTPRRRGGARLGFMTVLVAASAAVAVYIWTPTLAEQSPEAAPYLFQYQAFVDQLRVDLDTAVKDLVDRLGNAAASASGTGSQ